MKFLLAAASLHGSFAISDGGWALPERELLKPLDDGRCDLKRYPWPFKKGKEPDLEKPFIITGAALEWPASKHWGKESFLKIVDGATTVTQTGNEFAIFGPGSQWSQKSAWPVKSILSDETGSSGMVFDQVQNGSLVERLKPYIKVPDLFSKYEEPVISIGVEGQGMPFHAHGQCWLGVIYGKKRWWIYPPNDLPEVVYKQSALRSSLSWYEAGHAQALEGTPLEALQCTQVAGDVVYLPRYWHHATLNLGETVAVGGVQNYMAPDEGSEALFSKWVDQWPRSKWPRVLLANAQLGQVSMSFEYDKEATDKVIAALRELFEMYPYDFHVCTMIGDVLVTDSDDGPNKAVKQVQECEKKLISAEKDNLCGKEQASAMYERLGGWLVNTEWIYNKGKAQKKAQKVARELLQKSLKRNPQNTGALQDLGYMSLRQAKPQDALKHFYKVLAIDPQHNASQEGITAVNKKTASGEL